MRTDNAPMGRFQVRRSHRMVSGSVFLVSSTQHFVYKSTSADDGSCNRNIGGSCTGQYDGQCKDTFSFSNRLQP